MGENELFDEIKELAAGLIKIYEIKYEMVKPQVITIIKNRITNKDIIEHILDQTLDIPTDKGYELHSLLCRYFSMIDKESAEFYMNEYNNFWNEEDEEKWKDIKK